MLAFRVDNHFNRTLKTCQNTHTHTFSMANLKSKREIPISVEGVAREFQDA